MLDPTYRRGGFPTVTIPPSLPAPEESCVLKNKFSEFSRKKRDKLAILCENFALISKVSPHLVEVFWCLCQFGENADSGLQLDAHPPMQGGQGGESRKYFPPFSTS